MSLIVNTLPWIDVCELLAKKSSRAPVIAWRHTPVTLRHGCHDMLLDVFLCKVKVWFRQNLRAKEQIQVRLLDKAKHWAGLVQIRELYTRLEVTIPA
jgi:hypothetical protein